MRVLEFELIGKNAHFRRCNTTSTALSYAIPPRTTLMGVLGAVLGKSKGSYHSELHSKNIGIGVCLASTYKSYFMTVNNLKIEDDSKLESFEDFSSKHFRGAGNRIQTPTEILMNPEPNKNISYRIYVAETDVANKELFNEIVDRISNRKNIYPLSLGKANMGAYIRNVILYEENEVYDCEAKEEIIEFQSTVPQNDGDKKVIEILSENVGSDVLPGDFIADKDRQLSRVDKVFYSNNSEPLTIKYNGKYKRVTKNGISRNIIFFGK